MVPAARGAKGGGCIFRIDAFLIFLAIGFLLSLVLRTLVYNLKKYLENVRWMKGLAGGTLIADAEADYWLKLIKMANYRPIWRWHYGRQWTQKGTAIEASIKRKTLARKVGYINLILVSLIVFVLVFSSLNVRLVPEIPVQTSVKVDFYTTNLFEEYVGYVGQFYEVKNTTDCCGGWFAGETVGFIMTITRTDDAYVSKTVMLNLTSNMCDGANGTTTPCVSSVFYAIEDGSGKIREENVTSDSTFFGLSLEMGGQSSIRVLMLVSLRAFLADYYQNYSTFSTTGGTMGSFVYVSGGYYSPR